jgi:hypothetical protein
MERFTRDESERLDKILSVEINPFLQGHGKPSEFVAVHLGKTTQEWLFETRLKLPSDVRDELESIGFDELPEAVRLMTLNEILEERELSSAPKWWELNFFQVYLGDLWDFFLDQCKDNCTDQTFRDALDVCATRMKDLNEARNIIKVSKLNKERYSKEEIDAAMKTYDQSYPLDFADYNEVPQKLRSPLEILRYLIGPELSDLETVFTKRWFEFKILDELASYFSYNHDSERDSELSKKIARQLRVYMYGEVLSLGRMVEHYRWKFSYEADALKGIQSANASQARGMKGGQASGKAKRDNLEALLNELECLADLYPRMSEEAIMSQAYQNAAKKRKMPKSQKTIDDYGTILRSDRAYVERYRAIFQKNA